jgi:hypothetical protein
MVEVKSVSTKEKFKCTSKDIIAYNGACYQLITQTYYRNWCNLVPRISNKEFERLQKLNVLEEPVHKVGRLGINMTYYKFKESVDD